MSAPVKRRRLSKKARASILQKQGGTCCVPGCNETRNLEEEHSAPHTWTGALPDQLMCKPHHKAKTYGNSGSENWRAVGGDRRDIDHTNRLNGTTSSQVSRREERGFSLIRSAQKLFNRGFDKTLSKKFDGSVVRKNNG